MIFEELQKQYIIIDGMTFTPKYTVTKTNDNKGNITFDYTIIQSAEETYKKYLSLKDKEVVIEPTTQEQINAQLLEEIAQQKIVNAQLMQEIASLKGGTANV